MDRGGNRIKYGGFMFVFAGLALAMAGSVSDNMIISALIYFFAALATLLGIFRMSRSNRR